MVSKTRPFVVFSILDPIFFNQTTTHLTNILSVTRFSYHYFENVIRSIRHYPRIWTYHRHPYFSFAVSTLRGPLYETRRLHKYVLQMTPREGLCKKSLIPSILTHFPLQFDFTSTSSHDSGRVRSKTPTLAGSVQRSTLLPRPGNMGVHLVGDL